jgi:diketogulonate reductase-like aldo/keto reductase
LIAVVFANSFAMLYQLFASSVLCTTSMVATPVGKTIQISPGVFLPSVSLGTCCGSDPKVGIPSWFSVGGTGIDTALDYKDQPEIAQVLQSEHVSRSSYFMTTKIPTHRVTEPLTAEYALKQVRNSYNIKLSLPGM